MRPNAGISVCMIEERTEVVARIQGGEESQNAGMLHIGQVVDGTHIVLIEFVALDMEVLTCRTDFSHPPLFLEVNLREMSCVSATRGG